MPKVPHVFSLVVLALAAGCTHEIDVDRAPLVLALGDAIVSPPPDEVPAVPVEPRASAQPALRENPPPVVATSDAEQCVADLLPSAVEERWLDIPWRSDLLRARREANADGKPMFMWLMDGNPLGCT